MWKSSPFSEKARKVGDEENVIIMIQLCLRQVDGFNRIRGGDNE